MGRSNTPYTSLMPYVLGQLKRAFWNKSTSLSRNRSRWSFRVWSPNLCKTRLPTIENSSKRSKEPYTIRQYQTGRYCIPKDSHNDIYRESRRANTHLRTNNFTELLHTIYKQDGTISLLFPNTLQDLFAMKGRLSSPAACLSQAGAEPD